MVISSHEIRGAFTTAWPGLKNLWLRNKRYLAPSLEELETVLQSCQVDLPIIKDFNECENFALFLHAKVKENVVKSGKYATNWAFGDFISRKETSIQGTVVHSACICIVDTLAFYIIEPMEHNRIEKADAHRYDIFFVNLN